MKRIEKLVEVVKDHRVMIQTHNCPDPDAIASAFGLEQLLKYYHINAEICYDGRLENLTTLKMLDYFNINIKSYKEVEGITEDDYVVIVDGQKYNKNLTDIVGNEVACIDHHPTVIKCDYEYKDVRIVGACSSLIAEYIFEAGITPTVDVATALLYGIKVDTDDFQRGVTKKDVGMFYKLFRYADHVLINKIQMNSIEFDDLKAYGCAINSIQLHDNIGFACIPFDCPDGLIAIISDFILALDVVEFSIVYSKRKDGFKFSVRSEVEEFDAGVITRKALDGIGNGGGHAVMAGGFVVKEKLPDNDHKAMKIIMDRFIHTIEPN